MTLQAPLSSSARVADTTHSRAWATLGLMVVMLGLLVIPQLAFAGSGGGELDPIWNMLVDFVEGSLGRIITLLIIIVGIGAGILTQSLGAFAIGLGAGIGLAFSPDIVHSLFGATLTLIGGF